MFSDENNKKLTFSYKSYEKKCVKEDCVIIRVWTHPNNSDPGHVSVETINPKGYYSAWPNTNKAKIIAPIKFNTYSNDKIDENKDPQYVICLYSLHSSRINKRFLEMENHITEWKAFDGGEFFNNDRTRMSINCSSLAYELLQLGGIGSLYDSRGNVEHSLSFPSDDYGSSFSSIYLGGSSSSVTISPSQVQEIVIKSKKQELETYPETKGFIYERETPIEELYNLRNKCTIL